MDWTQYPPPNVYGLTGINYPTPIPCDIIIIEETPLRLLNPTTVPPNTLHHKDTSCRLTWQGPAKGNSTDISVRRIYANDRFAQEQYNLDQGLSDLSNADYPVFVRSYLLPRGFTPMTLTEPLTALCTIKVTAAGTTALADGIYDLTITPPISGTAATGKFQVINKKVVGAYFTNSGSGYDSDSLPAVTAPSTTGVTFSIFMQPKACILTDENEQKAEEMMQGRFVRVQRRWERVPGPLLAGLDTDETTGIITDYTKQVIRTGTLTDGIIGSVVTGLKILNPGTGATSSSVTLTIAPPGGGGTTATGTATIHLPAVTGSVTVVNVTNSGSGYTEPPTPALTGAFGSGWTGHTRLRASMLDVAVIVDAGNDLHDIPVLLISDNGGTGSGARAECTLIPAALDTTITTPGAPTGTGYDGTSTATISAPDEVGGTQATVTLVLGGMGEINGWAWTDAGSGYTKPATMTINPGTSGGSGAVIPPLLLAGTGLATVTLVEIAPYQSPVLTVVGSSTAIVKLKVKPTGVASVITDTAGGAYTAATVGVTFTGGEGAGAAGAAVIDTGYLSGVTLTGGGSLYTSAPVVTVSATGLTGAVVAATIGSRTYVKVTPINAIKSVAILSSIRKSSIPTTKSYPVSAKIKRDDIGSATLVIAVNNSGVDVGLNETVSDGGSAVVIATLYEMYMDESDYAAFVPPWVGSTSGASISETMGYVFYPAFGSPKIWTFRNRPIVHGDSAGLLDLSHGERLNFGIRRIIAIVLPLGALV